MHKNAFLRHNSKAIKETLESDHKNNISELSSMLISYEGARLNKNSLEITRLENKIQEYLIQKQKEKDEKVAS